MKTIHTLICDNCQHENPLFKSTCTNCSHYLRAAEVNIDLWETTWDLFENPTSTIKNIIFAEHKNFVFFLLILFSVKMNLINIIINSALVNNTLISFNISNLLFGSIVFLLTTLLLIKIITLVFNAPQKRTRYKDNLALSIYSFVPTIISLIVLLPIEYGIFGLNWFDYNPSPIVLKETTAYVFLGIEAIMVLWSIFLLGRSYFIQTNSAIKSIGSVIVFISILFILLNIFFMYYFSLSK